MVADNACTSVFAASKVSEDLTICNWCSWNTVTRNNASYLSDYRTSIRLSDSQPECRPIGFGLSHLYRTFDLHRTSMGLSDSWQQCRPKGLSHTDLYQTFGLPARVLAYRTRTIRPLSDIRTHGQSVGLSDADYRITFGYQIFGLQGGV